MSVDHTHHKLLKNSLVFKLSRIVFRFLLPFFGGLRVSGLENVPKSGSALICPNHTSDLDPVVICAATVRPDLNALAKSELFKVPIMGWYFHAIGATPVVRDSADRAALRIAEKILMAERMLLIFPEGRISRNGKLADLQLGAMLLSQKTNSPIIPVGIHGARNVLPYGRHFPKFAGGGVSVVFGKAIEPKDYAHLPHRTAQKSMADDLRRAVAELSGQE